MKKLLFLPGIFLCCLAQGQPCIGGAITSHDAFLYGRFETAMRSVGESGVVSSFFLYHVDLGCNWPEENNEIDIEMTGNEEHILFTTHYPGPWYENDVYVPDFNPHADLHDYAIEWEPGIVRWFVDGELVNVQDQSFVTGLMYPMRILMNLYVAELESWVGPWDPAVMPVESEYDYVRYYAYTPGTGQAGTGQNFTLVWEDDFDQLDTERWEVTEFGGFGGNLCSFESTSVETENGYLYLQLEAPLPDILPVPVTITVDLRAKDLLPTDQINLAGGFNNWCGDCLPMSQLNGIWSRTVLLPPGRHEFIFVKNFWEETGQPPLGSSCDFRPCDEWNNYGVLVPHGSAPMLLDPPCWGECESCEPTGTKDIQTVRKQKKCIKIVDILGREAERSSSQLLFYLYDDGSVVPAFELER